MDQEHPISQDRLLYEERALRVSQLDAEELDHGLAAMLSANLTRAVSCFGPSYDHRFTPEIHIILKVGLYLLGTANLSSAASPGMRLQNVKYANGLDRREPIVRRALILNILLSPFFLPGYVLTRLKLHALSSSFPDYPRGSIQRRWWLFLDRLETIGKWLELSSWLLFLCDGRYPSIVPRLLNLRMVPSDPFGNVTRMVSYEFMNRQLVWGAFTDFLLFLLPLLHSTGVQRLLPGVFSRIKRLGSSMISRGRQIDYALEPTRPWKGPSTIERSHTPLKEKTRPILWTLPKRTCPICHSRLHKNLDPNLGLPIPETPLSSLLTTAPRDHSDPEETAIHIPAQADCAEACVYCYHCLADALTNQQQLQISELKVGGDAITEGPAWFGLGLPEQGEMTGATEGGWECLRCGGRAWTCTRLTEPQ